MEHNSQPWRVATNRHPNTDGTSWGWIEGSQPVVYWSNEDKSKLKRAEAGRLVAEHNTWLERQTPVTLRLQQAREQKARLIVDMEAAQAAYRAACARVAEAQRAIEVIESEQAVSA